MLSASLVTKCYSQRLIVTFFFSCSAKVLGIPKVGEHAGDQYEKMASDQNFLPCPFRIQVWVQLGNRVLIMSKTDGLIALR